MIKKNEFELRILKKLVDWSRVEKNDALASTWDLIRDKWHLNLKENIKWDILDLVHANESVIIKTWMQCDAQARKLNKEPILVFSRKNNVYILINIDYLSILENYFGAYKGYNVSFMIMSEKGKIFDVVNVMDLGSFLNWASNPKLILQA